MEKITWIKDLVKAEQQMEESGLVDMSVGFNPERALASDSIQFLLNLKTELVDAASVFNDMKSSALGRIKIYGIANTHCDFMLFRNGFKMIFSLKSPGQISIKLNFIGGGYIPGATQVEAQNQSLMEEHIVEAQWGAFGEVIWTYQGKPVKSEFMVRHYLSRFIKESSK